MTATISKRFITAAGWLCTLALAACDDPDAPLAEAEALEAAEAADGRVVSEDELRDLCELARSESDEAPPPLQGPGEVTDVTRPAEGVCSTGEWVYSSSEQSCGTCWHDAIQQSGRKVESYRRWCYRAPSPPSCGCEGPELVGWQCKTGC